MSIDEFFVVDEEMRKTHVRVQCTSDLFSLLPALGVVPTGGISGNLFSFLTRTVGSRVAAAAASDDRSIAFEEKVDRGAVPLTIAAFSAMGDANATLQRSKSIDVSEEESNGVSSSPLALMSKGEVGYDPNFGMSFCEEKKLDTKSNGGDPLVPNPFIVSRDWARAIEGMEELLKQQQGSFDPESRSLFEPTPVHDAILPDLYLGWGNAECTHTNREIVKNRLMCCLLNRLGMNYCSRNEECAEAFVVRMDERASDITNSADFVEALIRSGHTVSCCPRSTITTFGVAFCVKEKDGGWSNVPLAFFLQSGYENEEAKVAHAHLPHGGTKQLLKKL